MKAVDYFNKYANRIMKDSVEGKMDAAFEMFSEMYSEIREIYKIRRGATQSAIISIVKEVNQKWNKTRKLIKEMYSVCPLKEDAIQVRFIKDNPSFESGFVITRGMEKDEFDSKKAADTFENLSPAAKFIISMAMLGSPASNLSEMEPRNEN